jgi:hypothetical protein
MRSKFVMALFPLLGLLLAAAVHAGADPLAPAPATAPAKAKADSTSRLPLCLIGEGGIGWMSSPSEVRRRYNAGVDVALSVELRGRSPWALAARAEYHDFPNSSSIYSGYYNSNGAFPTSLANATLVSGRAYDLVISPMLRFARDWWIDAGAGYGYFDSGFGSDQTFIDGATGQEVKVPGTTGWCGVATAGIRYEFQPNPRDRVLVGGRWYELVLKDRTLQCFRLGAGYRFQ